MSARTRDCALFIADRQSEYWKLYIYTSTVWNSFYDMCEDTVCYWDATERSRDTNGWFIIALSEENTRFKQE